MASPKPQGDVRYTVFIKVPFSRGAFEDPPDADWDASKDGELWKILSSTSKGAEIDWDNLAHQFGVTLHFLLQQAAWLYERQLSQVREQLRRVGKPSTGTLPTPPPGSGSAGATTSSGGYAMRRGGSSGSRMPPSLSVRPRRSMESRHEGSSVPSTPVQGRITYSRTTSKDTITPAGRGTTPGTHVPAREAAKSPKSSVIESKASAPMKDAASTSLASPTGGLSGSDSSGGPEVSQSRAFARRPQFSTPKGKARGQGRMLSSTEEDDEDDEDAPAFLPLSSHRDSRVESAPFLASQRPIRTSKSKLLPTMLATDRADAGPSDSSSQQSLSSPPRQTSSVPSVSSQGPVRPRSNPLAALSPKQRRAAQDSEGTPSMGSSFSDLDDASVTQSALEEALAREMKAGKGSLGVVSRMGGLWKAQGGSSKRTAPE